MLTLVIENPLNARSLLSKAKLPNLVLCALLGKCHGAFIVLFTCFYHAFTNGTILIISPTFSPLVSRGNAAMSSISSLKHYGYVIIRYH